MRFIKEYPDYPSWVICEAFKEKFGVEVEPIHVTSTRAKSRGSTNFRSRKGKQGKRTNRRAPPEQHEMERLRRYLD